jgi:nucleotide-binding universal stress UspA family protein
VAPVVFELAEEHDAELIVIAAPERPRRGGRVSGRTATALLHRATGRVLLIASPKPA